MITWIKKKLAEWKESFENQRRIDEALREIAQEMHQIYLDEFNKYYELKLRELLEEKKNAAYKN